MSLKSKIEAVIYASEEPVTLQQLVGLLAGEAQGELDDLAQNQASLPLEGEAGPSSARSVVEAGAGESPAHEDAAGEQAINEGQVVAAGPGVAAPIAPMQADAPEDSPVTELPDAEQVPSSDAEKRQARDRERAVREYIRRICDQLIREYAETDRGIEIREVASGFRMGTKPEYHDAVRGFVKSLKPALRLTLQALETLAVVAYKQPVTAAEISEIRGVDSAGVLGGLMTRKLIATAGRKQVIGRPMLYKTTRDFLLRFGLKDVTELPSMEEFERMASELAEQEDLPMENADSIIERANARGDAEHIRETNDNEDKEATAETAAGGNNEEERRDTAAGESRSEEEQPEAEAAGTPA